MSDEAPPAPRVVTFEEYRNWTIKPSTVFQSQPIPQVIQPLHPKGLRAFPPELRRFIFIEYFITVKSSCFVNIEDFGNRTEPSKVLGTKANDWPALFHSLQGIENGLWDEAMRAFSEVGVVLMCGFGSTTHRKPFSFLGPNTSPIPDCGLSHNNMLLIRNLEVNMKTCHILHRNELIEFDSTMRPWSIEKSDAAIISFRSQFAQKFLSQFPNIENITFDFKFFNDLLSYGLLKDIVGHLRKLTKISMVFDGQMKEDYYALTEFLSHQNPKNHWFAGCPMRALLQFEGADLATLSQGLGANPKLDRILPVTLGEVQVNGSTTTGFWRQALGTTYAPDTTWFWQAEKGKTLTWDENRVQNDWMGFLPWEDQPGKTLVWKEDLVTRGSDGSIYFLHGSSAESENDLEAEG